MACPPSSIFNQMLQSHTRPNFSSATVHEVTSLFVQRAHKIAALEKQVFFQLTNSALSHAAFQLDGVVESMQLQRVIPLADPPIASYSELVAAWGWIGRGSQVFFFCVFRACQFLKFFRELLTSCTIASLKPSICAPKCRSDSEQTFDVVLFSFFYFVVFGIKTVAFSLIS